MRITRSRVAVTGGAGFIGSHLVDRLLEARNEVVVIDDLSAGSRDQLAHHGEHPALHVEVADVLDEGAMRSLVRGCRFVFHLAARNVRLSLRQPTNVHEVNATGTLNVLKAAAAAGVERFLYCSSSEVCGTADVVPMPEAYDFKPETIYGASKLVGEYYTLVFHRSGWLPGVVARPHNSYGPREHYDGFKGEVIPRFILRALAGQPPVIFGTGSQTRDFTYVEETAEFLVRILEHEAAFGETFNVCRGEEVSIREIAAIVSELTGLARAPEHLPGRPSDVLRLYGDPSRLAQALGGAPQVTIREGLQRTVAWFREHVPLTPEVLEAMDPQNWAALEQEGWMSGLSGEPASGGSNG